MSNPLISQASEYASTPITSDEHNQLCDHLGVHSSTPRDKVVAMSCRKLLARQVAQSVMKASAFEQLTANPPAATTLSAAQSAWMQKTGFDSLSLSKDDIAQLSTLDVGEADRTKHPDVPLPCGVSIPARHHKWLVDVMQMDPTTLSASDAAEIARMNF